VDRVRVVAAVARRLPLRARAAAVLVDAPCSGLGTIGRHPDLRWRVSRTSLGRHARRQGALLEAAAAAVAPGGRLVYSTCSSEPEENADVVGEFRTRHPEFAPEPLPAWAARYADGDSVSTLPERDGGDAFCAAVLRRR
jgi:16S rRNA (cytosine967-C5)-methyltransferase